MVEYREMMNAKRNLASSRVKKSGEAVKPPDL